MIFIRTLPNVMQHFNCSADNAQRYIDLREEGYGMEQASLMAGISDPPEPQDEQEQFVSENKTEREAFEAWAKPQGYRLQWCYGVDAGYASTPTHHAWEGWQARAAIPQAVSAEPSDFLLTDAYAEGRRDEQAELSSVLPGVTYMDPPDGGAPTVLEQLQRQAKDAARYLWLRNNKAYVAVQPHYQDLPKAQRTGWTIRLVCGNDESFDAAIDAAMQPKEQP